MPWKHALRDVGLLLITLVLWRIDAGLRQQSGVFPILIAVAAGSMASIVGYLAHEWGHFSAARAGGSVMRTPASPTEMFLFNFDSDRNSREQFLLMSSGGFLASAIVIVVFLMTLPFPSLSSLIALGLTIAGVIATAVLEVPPFLRVWHGAPIPRGGAYISAADPTLPS
jgi:peptidoglycan/LPS O-acetylase OafA/YrhL